MYTAAIQLYFDTGSFLLDTVSETEIQRFVVLEWLYVKIWLGTQKETIFGPPTASCYCCYRQYSISNGHLNMITSKVARKRDKPEGGIC